MRIRQSNAALKIWEVALNIHLKTISTETSIVLNRKRLIRLKWFLIGAFHSSKNKAVVGGNASLMNLVFTKMEFLKILTYEIITELVGVGSNGLPLGRPVGSPVPLLRKAESSPRFYRRDIKPSSFVQGIADQETRNHGCNIRALVAGTTVESQRIHVYNFKPMRK